MDRRTFAAYTPAALVALAAEWRGVEPSTLAAASEGRRIDDELLTWLEATTDRLTTLITSQRQHAVRLLDAHLATLTDLLVHASHDATTGRALRIQLARTAIASGWYHFDQAGHGRASRLWHAALHAAHEAGEHDLGAGALSDLAYQATWLGHPGTATQILDHALTRTTHPTSRSLLHLRRARAHALLDDARACTADLSAAETHLRTADNPPAWCAWMQEADLTVDTGRALADLGHTAEALRHISTGLEQLPAARAKTKAVFLAYQAGALLQNQEPEQAAAAAQQSAMLANDLGAERCLTLLNGLRPRFALYGHRDTSVRGSDYRR